MNVRFGVKRTSTNSVYCLDSSIGLTVQIRHNLSMFEEIYIEALLVDEDLADQVWAAWDKGEIDDLRACMAWWLVATGRVVERCSGRQIT